MALSSRCLPAWCRCVGLFLLVQLSLWAAPAGEGRILKVLPHFLDAHGRHSLSPSLFQRDAYQSHLRKHPDEVSTIRYDIQWQTRRSPTPRTGSPGSNALKLRLSLRTALRAPQDPLILESEATPGFFGRAWTPLQVTPEVFRASGKVLAWRVVLLDGDREVASQQSFLW